MTQTGGFREKALVTGAGGFIGSHLVEQLAARGHDVICLLKYKEDSRWLQGLPVQKIEGDLSDRESLRRAAAGVSLVFHLAGRIGGWSDAAAFEEINVAGTRNLYEAFRDCGRMPRRFLFASSFAAVGGTPNRGIYDENWEAAPFSAYGRSKLLAENYLLAQEIPATVLRLPLVYGPRCFRGIYPIFKLAAHGLRLSTVKVSTVVGFVEDVARGIALAAESPAAAGQVYFLGEDRIYDSDEICAAISAGHDRRPLKVHVPYAVLYGSAFLMEMAARLRKKNPLLWRRSLTEYLHRHYRFTTEKARRDFGFASQVQLAEGACRTFSWYRQQGHL